MAGKRKSRRPKHPPLPRCGEKTCYPNERMAVRVLLRQARYSGLALSYYYHPVCGAWHLTRRPQEAPHG